MSMLVLLIIYLRFSFLLLGVRKKKMPADPLSSSGDFYVASHASASAMASE